jgi:NAD(P)-dependent dehydrogenase (short-subunit alcohol dehydrogenase family)
MFRTALLTGASSGIGRELARQLAARGTLVVATARRAELLEELAAEARAAGGEVRPAVLDVTDAEAVRAVVERADRDLDGLELVVANAGVGLTGLDWPSVERTLEVNVRGACATLVAALPLLRARGRGTLAGVSSLAGVRGMPGSGAYSASKAALATFLETLAIELAGSGVRVCDVQPGFVRTAMTDQNTGAMPFLMELEPAVRRVVRGLERGRRIVAFPRPMAWSARGVLRWLPSPVWIALARVLASRSETTRP